LTGIWEKDYSNSNSKTVLAKYIYGGGEKETERERGKLLEGERILRRIEVNPERERNALGLGGPLFPGPPGRGTGSLGISEGRP
jgi:hypothetical protein